MAILVTLLATPSWAADDDIDKYDFHIMQPRAVSVHYAQHNQDLALHLVTSPPVTGCGMMTSLPHTLTFDINAADIRVEEYAFIRPKSGEVKDCGPAYKVAQARLTLSADDLAGHDIERIRFWYQNAMDTFLVTREGRTITLTPAGAGQVFTLGKRQDHIAMPSDQEAESSSTSQDTKPDLTNLLLLSTGDDAVDQKMRDAIRELATGRGLNTTDDPDIYFDKTGDYYKHLGTQPVMEIGAMMVDGKRTPVYATRLDNKE
jgi:hypothetical protein